MKDNEDYIITGNAIAFSNGYSVDFEYPIKETVLVDKAIIIVVEVEILMNVTTPFRRKLTTHSGRN